MKHSVRVVALKAALSMFLLQAQETYVYYDQVAPWPGHPEAPGLVERSWRITGEAGAQFSQSFTPFMNYIDFIDLQVEDVHGDGLSPKAYLVLRAQSVDGPIIASTDPVTIADGYMYQQGNWMRFTFPQSVRILAYHTCYFQPMVEPGTGAYKVYGNFSAYTAGMSFIGTKPDYAYDMFFREGLIEIVPAIPEPSTVALALAGLPALAWAMRKHSRPSLR